VPVDDSALNLLEDALDYHFVGEDENGDPIGSGEFSMYQLLEFWSGYDESKEVQEGYSQEGVRLTYYAGGPILTHKDVIQALIDEIRRLRNGS
jgi:hypothetical protein